MSTTPQLDALPRDLTLAEIERGWMENVRHVFTLTKQNGLDVVDGPITRRPLTLVGCVQREGDSFAAFAARAGKTEHPTLEEAMAHVEDHANIAWCHANTRREHAFRSPSRTSLCGVERPLEIKTYGVFESCSECKGILTVEEPGPSEPTLRVQDDVGHEHTISMRGFVLQILDDQDQILGSDELIRNLQNTLADLLVMLYEKGLLNRDEAVGVVHGLSNLSLVCEDADE